MVQKYVWWDEIEKHKRVRIDLRAPEPIVDVLKEVAQRNGVSLNALLVGLLGYAVDSNRHRRLRVEVVPSVRITEFKPESDPVVIPATNATGGTA